MSPLPAWNPTHRLIFRHANGDVMCWSLMVINKDPSGTHQGAYSHREWANELQPNWACDDGEWTWRGQSTPYGQQGTIHVEEWAESGSLQQVLAQG
jgi:hypothetical protein